MIFTVKILKKACFGAIKLNHCFVSFNLVILTEWFIMIQIEPFSMRLDQF